MKLYLSSIGIPHPYKLEQLIGKSLTQVRVVIVPNALDLKENKRREELLQLSEKKFRELGLTFSFFDLNDLREMDSSISKIKNHDLIWFLGGNTFYLRYLMNKFGFDIEIKKMLNNGLVYGGESAGATITGPTLEGVEMVDSIKQVPQVIKTGLGLLDYAVIPHWGNEKYQKVLTRLKNAIEKQGIKVKTISDSEDLVINI